MRFFDIAIIKRRIVQPAVNKTGTVQIGIVKAAGVRSNTDKIINEQLCIGKQRFIKRTAGKARKLNIRFVKGTLHKMGKIKKAKPDLASYKRAIFKGSMRKRTSRDFFRRKIKIFQHKV